MGTVDGEHVNVLLTVTWQQVCVFIRYITECDSFGVSIHFFPGKADKVGGNWADEGQQQRQHDRSEAPLGGRHHSAEATAGDSHVIL